MVKLFLSLGQNHGDSIMDMIKKQYIVDEKNRKIGVRLDIGTFNKIEELLENYALVQLMKENENEDKLDRKNAETFYRQLEKAAWKLSIEENF